MADTYYRPECGPPGSVWHVCLFVTLWVTHTIGKSVVWSIWLIVARVSLCGFMGGAYYRQECGPFGSVWSVCLFVAVWLTHTIDQSVVLLAQCSTCVSLWLYGSHIL